MARAQAPAAPAAPAAAVHFFAADTTEAGVVSLTFFGAKGAPVNFFERIENYRKPLGAITAGPDAPSTLKAAVTWRCDRLVRNFEATSTLPDGTLATGAYSVRTPSCATRLQLAVPRRLAPGSVGRIRVIDRWSNGGVAPQVCITPPEGKRECRELRLRRAVAVATRRFRPQAPGRWRVELRLDDHSVRRSIAVGDDALAAEPPPIVLATGDSTMQGVDSFLADELGDAATVEREVQPGTAISKSRSPWKELPGSQTKRLGQATTVVSIGASEGFPMRAPDGIVHVCCADGWVTEYAGRVRTMMRTYRRKGNARVIWLTLPVPKGKRDTADAVNAAIVRAAAGLDDVSVLRFDLLFSPEGFQEVIRYRGRDVRVREPDGIHLNIAGAAIAAKLVAAEIRRR